MKKLISLVLYSLTIFFSIGATAASNEVFAATPILLPDLRPKYELLCGNQTSAQTLDLADLNGDGRKDIVVGLWCAIPPGTVTHEPVVGGLLAFTQNADGSFVDRTNALFGSELPSIEKPFENVVYDFNDDGYDDIFMTQSREDGRADPWDARDNIENAIVMSNGDGTYSILRDGCNDPCGTGYNSHAMDNEVGGIDVVTQSIGAGAVQVWRYTNEWEYISNLDNSGGLVFFNRTDPELATLVYSSASRVDGVPAVNLYTRINPNDAWNKVDTLSMQADTTIATTWTAWNGDAGPIDIRVLDGQYYLGGSYEYGCEITTQADTDLNLVYLNTSYMLDSYYDGMDIVEGRDMKWIYKLFGFSAKDGNLTSIPIILQAPVALTDKPYRLHCEDVNQDGRDDIIVATWGDETHPHIYINTGGNNFSLVREELWPPITDALKSAQQKYADVNGDEIFDIVSFPFTGVNNISSDVIMYEILLGKNHFQANDTYDADSDGVINATDGDDDDDGVPDESDAFPLDAAESLDTDGDGVGDNADVFDNDPGETTDSDSDGVGDNGDAFPLDGSESLDTDLDGTGNNADTDDDGDTVLDGDDAFPLDATESVDTDSDGIGNNADTDDDGDTVLDGDDAFPLDATESVDTDSDGIGNNADTDDDGDTVLDGDDAFPLDATESVDTDSDGIGNNADTDDDGDTVLDGDDAFPLDATESVDTDSDGIGNNADTNDDGDGVLDGADAFPLDATESVDTDSDGIGNNADTDDDGDGVSDSNDDLPLDPTNDSDNDGVANNADVYPENSLYSKDSDSDGMPDAWETKYRLDPNDPSDTTSDRDNDGVTALDEFLAGTIPSGSIDLDGNEKYDALTDGLLLLRGMFGLDGSALVTGTIAPDATYTESVDIESRIATLGDLADIDGNGQIDALTDGLLTLRYLFGLQGDTLINGVVAGDATRKTAEEIEAHLETLMPAL